jgi:hypothetical protein
MTPYGRATSARARRVTRSNHELFNATMKYVTVVVGDAHALVLNCSKFSTKFSTVFGTLLFFIQNNLKKFFIQNNLKKFLFFL